MLDPKSAILSALYNRQPEEAQRLVELAVELTIWEAAALGRVDVIDTLLDRDPALVNAFGADGNVPLGLAAFFGKVDGMQRLIERGADVRMTARNFMKVQPLHAAVAARSAEGVALLLARGADVNARQQVGYTPLMGAASGGRDDIVDLLLGKGADPSLVSEDGKTAASIAAEHGHTKVAAKLADLRPAT
jgi:ankyrin repeat protein